MLDKQHTVVILEWTSKRDRQTQSCNTSLHSLFSIKQYFEDAIEHPDDLEMGIPDASKLFNMRLLNKTIIEAIIRLTTKGHVI